MRQLRFAPNTDGARAELANLFHLARSVVGNDRYERKLQAARWYASEHANVSVTGAYKDLCTVLEWEEIPDERSSGKEIRR